MGAPDSNCSCRASTGVTGLGLSWQSRATVPAICGAENDVPLQMAQAFGPSMAQALWEARTSADLERAEDYVAWSGVTAYGAA
jgi:hypothetical protein